MILVCAVILRRFVKQILFPLRDERRLRWAETVDEILRRGEVTAPAPSKWFGARQAAEEALLERLRTATSEQRPLLESLFRTWGFLEMRRVLLRRGDNWERAHSALVLGRIHCTEALPDLLWMLERAEADTQVQIVNALELLREPTAIEALIEFLVRRGERATRPVLSALIGCGRSAPERLLPYLNHKLALVRTSVAAALAEVASVHEVSALIQAVSDSEPEVRAKVARAMGRAADPRAFEALRRLAADPVWYVRLRAIDALSQIPLPEVPEQLLQGLRDKDRRVRAKAAIALYRIAGDPVSLLRKIREELKDRYALEALVTALEREGTTWRAINNVCSSTAGMRQESQALIIELLRARKFTSVLYALEALPDQAVRQELLRLVSEEAGPSVREPLQGLLESRTLNGEMRLGVEMLMAQYQKEL